MPLTSTRYRRPTPEELGEVIESDGYRLAIASCARIIELVRSDRYMWLMEVVSAALQYNADFQERAFPVDPKVIQHYLTILVAGGAVKTQEVVWVVTQGCRYGGDRETVIGVAATPELAKAMADDWWREHGDRINRDCPGQGAEPVVSEAALSDGGD